MRWFTQLRLQVDEAAVASGTVRDGDELVEQDACREASGGGLSEIWDPVKVEKSGGEKEEVEAEKEGDDGFDAVREEEGTLGSEAEQGAETGDVHKETCLEGLDHTPTLRFDLRGPGMKTSFAFTTGASSSLDSTRTFSFGKVNARHIQAEIVSTAEGMRTEATRNMDHDHDSCPGNVPDQHATDCLGAKSAESTETFDFEAWALSILGSRQACNMEAPRSASAQGSEQVGLGGGQQSKVSKRKSRRGDKGSWRRRDEVHWAKNIAEREAAEKATPPSAGVLYHEENQAGDDYAGQSGGRKTSFVFATRASRDFEG